jgi:hypothetical protein
MSGLSTPIPPSPTGGPGPGQAGFGGGQFAVTLGSVTLQGFEVPDEAPWGGEQALTVHKMVGGARIIDAMGRDDRLVEIKGLFLSPDADNRAQQVDTMRKAGLPVIWSYGSHVYQVVIKAFLPDFKQRGRIPYHLKLEVLIDYSQPSALITLSLDDQFSFSLLTVSGLCTGLLGGLLGVASLVFGTVGLALAAVTGAIGIATGLLAGVLAGLPLPAIALEVQLAIMIGAVAGGISGPAMATVAAALAIGGSIAASNTANIAAAIAQTVAAQQLTAEAIAFSETILGFQTTTGGVAPGQSPAQNADNLTLFAAVTTADAQMQALQAQLAVMQQILEQQGP